MMQSQNRQPRPNIADAGLGANGIIDASHSPSPDPKRLPNHGAP